MRSRGRRPRPTFAPAARLHAPAPKRRPDLERPEISTALAIARKRYEAIAGGDFETYAAEDSALGEACAKVVTLGADALGAHDVPQLDELIALETQSRRLLQTMMNEASTSLASLRKTRTANGAYAANERLSVNGV